MSSSRSHSLARCSSYERVRCEGSELANLEYSVSSVRAINDGLAASPDDDRSHFARSSKPAPCASVKVDVANMPCTDLRWSIGVANAIFEPSMMFGRIVRSSDDSTNAFDVRVGARAPMLSIASPFDLASEEVHCPTPSHLKMTGKGSHCLPGVSWSSDAWTRWAARRQESPNYCRRRQSDGRGYQESGTRSEYDDEQMVRLT